MQAPSGAALPAASPVAPARQQADTAKPQFTATVHPFVATCAVGAAARLTRLVTRDTITQPLRDWVLFNRAQRQARLRNEPIPAPTRPTAARARSWLHSLLTCDWCAGLWISAAVVTATALWRDTPAYWGTTSALTVSHAVGLLAAHDE